MTAVLFAWIKNKTIGPVPFAQKSGPLTQGGWLKQQTKGSAKTRAQNLCKVGKRKGLASRVLVFGHDFCLTGNTMDCDVDGNRKAANP